MQFLTALLLFGATAQAHYTFTRLIVNGKVVQSKDWVDTRKTKNDQGKQGVQSVSSSDIRCYGGTSASAVTTVNAGDTISFVSSQQINHPGPQSYYLAKVPSGAKVESWDPTGNVFFKVFTTTPTFDSSKNMKWAQPPEGSGSSAAHYYTFPFTLPKSVPSGDYILRAEQIALHQAQSSGGAQIYISCAQIRVENGGSGTPGPLVSFPGAYSQNDPGIMVNIYSQTGSYKPPGPSVWSG